ncbi:hypothetical protein AAVH_06163 [Aphelenchoides avenae]|nr:hypothetical protein AAVH_06163 [Aphelenchus avenae]
MKAPKYEVVRPSKLERINVKPEVKDVREFVVSAILRDTRFTKESYASFIDLQDKFHQNICRKRTLVSIGTHDLDTVKGPFEYRAEAPTSIVFKPLKEEKDFNGAELMDKYSNDSHLREYVPIIRDKKLYPVIRDTNDVVCSLPPIINSEHSKITLDTKNVFIEITATDRKKAEIVLDVLVAMFGQYCAKPFTVEPVEVVYPNGETFVYPKYEYREQKVNIRSMNTKIGLDLSKQEISKLLKKMSLDTRPGEKEDELVVIVPPVRHDILHECDVAEDIGLAYGYNNIPVRMPEANTIAQPFPLNKLSDQLRVNVAAAGWTEVLNFSLCSSDDISSKLRQKDGLSNAVRIANPKTLDFQVARNTLLTGLLKTLACNLDQPLPLKLFEVQDIVVKDNKCDTNSRNERHLAAIYYSKTGGFEVIHGFLDRVMEVLDVPFSSDGSGYYIRASNNPTYFEGRCAEVVGPKNRVLGVLGILHPEVLANFSLTMPCSAMEINIEPFL